ncbi:MAG: TolC family protein, partial [Cycloclasticus sp.]
MFERVDGDITRIPKLASFVTLSAQLPQNPEFARLLSNQLLKKAELKLALAQSKPSWHLNAGVRHANNNDDQAFVVGISIPFGERTRNAGRIAEARANLAKTNSNEQATRIRIETALFVIYEKLQHSLHVIETVQGEIIPSLEQALIETRRAYRLGRYSYMELRSVQEELLGAQNNLVEASINAQHNIIEIERLTGVRIAQPKTELGESQ